MQALLSRPNPLSSDALESGSHRSLFIGGLRLVVANPRLLLWFWLANLLCGLLATLPFTGHIAGFLNHSLAAQEIAGRVDLGYLDELIHQAGKHAAIDPTPALLSIALFAFINFILVGGSLFVFLSAAPARLSVVADAGVRYFWRFVRLTIVAALSFSLTLWLLAALRDTWLRHVGRTQVGAAFFWRAALSIGVMSLIALLLRFYFDLAEAVVVQMGIAGDSRVHRSFPAAFRLLRTNFFRAFFVYFVSGTIGVALFALALWIWVAALSPYSNGLAFLLGQFGIAALFAGRLWQRASLAYLVILHTAATSPAIAPEPTLEASDLRTIW
jgi:hypothetical protein